MKIKPLGDRVLVRPEDDEAEQQGGIYIPDSAKEKPQTGVVVAVGTSEDILVKVDDVVVMPKYGGAEVKVDGVEHQLLRQEDILGIIS